MGLDMYLERHRYVKNWDHYTPERRTDVTLKVGGIEQPLTCPTTIIEELGYWRKANAIHKFFCNLDDGKDECQTIYVSKENLIELKRRCDTVLADHNKAAELLPPQSGFFFGSTEIDEYYFDDLRDTLKIIEPIIEGADDHELYYRASW